MRAGLMRLLLAALLALSLGAVAACGDDDEDGGGGGGGNLSGSIRTDGSSTVGSKTTTLSRIATRSAGGTGTSSVRCCQPRASRRFVSTCTKPLSESMMASRMGELCDVTSCRVYGPSPPKTGH